MKRLKNWLLKKLFKAATFEDIKSEFNQLNKSEQELIKRQAKEFQGTKLQEFMRGQMMKHAQKRMFFDAKNEQDMLFGKAMMHSEKVRKDLMKLLCNEKKNWREKVQKVKNRFKN